MPSHCYRSISCYNDFFFFIRFQTHWQTWASTDLGETFYEMLRTLMMVTKCIRNNTNLTKTIQRQVKGTVFSKKDIKSFKIMSLSVILKGQWHIKSRVVFRNSLHDHPRFNICRHAENQARLESHRQPVSYLSLLPYHWSLNLERCLAPTFVPMASASPDVGGGDVQGWKGLSHKPNAPSETVAMPDCRAKLWEHIH